MVRSGAWILLFLLVASIVSAAPPGSVFTSQTQGELSIAYPKLFSFEAGEPFKLHFHVYNETGYQLTNASTNCTIHIYDQVDSHIYKQNLTFDGIEWEITNITINETGEYAYIVWCVNNRGVGGFSSDFFEMTTDGHPSGSNNWPLIAIILLPLIFGFLLVYGASLFDPVEHFALRMFLFLIAVIMLFASVGLGLIMSERFLLFPALEDFLGDFMLIAGWGVIILLILYWVIYFIYRTFKEFQEKKEY